ncbi:Stomatal closure-related actin-binding protein 1 [Zea mays]|uniref:Stomatal closure-related actin-binding protein 1 n=1 Tax=Zea mays TaxID=4577 RepID=A0A1D6FNC8_MAIZE|nr:Stomatal closure-related actin-binding protein 1 [Zea mays]
MRTAAATVPAAPALGVGLQSQLPIAAAAGKEGPALLASTDAKRIIDEERANARLEIGRAKASVQKIQSALKEQEKFSHRTGKQDVDELKEEVQEAPRVKMLHCPSKAMDIENEIQVLCDQLAKTSSYSLRLLKVLELHRSYGENDMPLYELKGTTKPAYAPEPHDVGRYTQAEVKSGGQTSITKTAGSVHPGLVHYVEALVRRRETGYDVVILQVNGVAQAADSVHILCIGRLQMRLAKEKTIIVKEFYST